MVQVRDKGREEDGRGRGRDREIREMTALKIDRKRGKDEK